MQENQFEQRQSIVPQSICDRINRLRVALARAQADARPIEGWRYTKFMRAMGDAKSAATRWLAAELRRALDEHEDGLVAMILSDRYFSPAVLNTLRSMERFDADELARNASREIDRARFESTAERISLGREVIKLRSQVEGHQLRRQKAVANIEKANAERLTHAVKPRILEILRAMHRNGRDIRARDIASEVAGRIGCTPRHVRAARAELVLETEVR